MEPEGSLPRSQVPATCPYPEPDQPTRSPPHHTCWRSVLILSSHLRPRVPSGLLPSGFLAKILIAPVPSPLYAKCSAHFILLDFLTRNVLGEEYRSGSSSLHSFLHSPVTLSPSGPNILSTLFSHTLSLRSSLNDSGQFSHPYKEDKIIVLYILIFIFLDSKNWKTKDSAPNDSKHSLILICSLFLRE